MNLDAATWSRVTELFDRLADLPDERRRTELERIGPDPIVREWLQRLLEAHDRPEELLIDRTLDQLTARLTGDVAMPDDWRGVRFGNWEAVEEISRGGMATVMRGRRADGAYEQEAAIKVLQPGSLSPTGRQQLADELRVLAGLEHPGIVRLLDGGFSDDGWPFLVMEYVRGQPIDEWCRARQADLPTRIGLVRQVADAVAWAHARLVVHADLKPSNVLVDDEGRVRVVDFGIASRLGRDAPEHAHPVGRALRCSPAYASPEQLRGEPAAVASDVYGLGAVLYELLAGRRLRDGAEVTRLLVGADFELEAPAPSAAPDPDVPRRALDGDLDAVCRRALAVDPARRYASITALAEDLERWRTHRPVAARPAALRLRARKWMRRHWLPASAASLAAIALVAGTSVALWQAERAGEQARLAERQAARAETVKDFLLEMFHSADPWLAGGGELDLRDVLAQGSRQAERDETLDPAIKTELLTVLGDVQVALGWHDDAARMFDRAEAVLEQHDELPDELRGRLWLERAVLEGVRSAPAEREVALNQALALLPPADEPVGRVLRARAWAEYAAHFAESNRADEAREAFDRTERLLDAPGDPLPEIRRNLLSARAILAFNRGELETAYKAMLAARDLQLSMGNARHATMVRTLSNLAGVAAQLGRLDEALAHDSEAAALAMEIYPDGHPAVARALYAFGDTLRQHGRYDEALEKLDKARAIQVDVGQDAERALVDMVRARTLLALGRGAEAAVIAADARRTLEPLWGETQRTVLQALDFEVHGHALSGDREKTLRSLALARSRLDALQTPARWQWVAQLLRWRLARTLHETGDDEGTRALLAEAESAPDDIAQHPSVTLRWLALGVLLNGVADTSSVERILAEAGNPAANDDARAYALCALRNHLPAEHVHASEVIERLAAVRRSTTLSHEGRVDARCTQGPARKPLATAGRADPDPAETGIPRHR
jgi:serine/threonine-protein kinase